MNNYNFVFLFIAILSVILSSLALGVAVKLRNSLRKLTKSTGKENLDEMLIKLLEYLDLSKKEQELINERLDNLEKAAEFHIQKIGLVRFNPFAETGGEQSFSLALLDGQSNGFVISSLHNRDQTRIYVKAVTEGRGLNRELSKEENKAVTEATNKLNTKQKRLIKSDDKK